MTALTLCRLSRAEAERLMLAPANLGGWIAVRPDCRDAVETALGGSLSGAWADCLAMLPAHWPEASRRPVPPEIADRIVTQLDRVTRYPIVGDEDDSTPATTIAERVRAWLAAQQTISEARP